MATTLEVFLFKPPPPPRPSQIIRKVVRRMETDGLGDGRQHEEVIIKSSGRGLVGQKLVPDPCHLAVGV